MLKIEYIYNGECGETTLDSIVGFNSIQEFYDDFDLCVDLPICVIESLLAKLDLNKISRNTSAAKR